MKTKIKKPSRYPRTWVITHETIVGNAELQTCKQMFTAVRSIGGLTATYYYNDECLATGFVLLTYREHDVLYFPNLDRLNYCVPDLFELCENMRFSNMDDAQNAIDIVEDRRL